MILINSRTQHNCVVRPGNNEGQSSSPRRRFSAAVAALAGAALLAGSLASSASATSVPSIPGVNVAALESSLQAAPGVTPAQAQAVISDLTQLQSGGVAPNLTGDVDAVITAIGQASGESALLQPVLNTVAEIADGLLGGNFSSTQAEELIQELEGVS